MGKRYGKTHEEAKSEKFTRLTRLFGAPVQRKCVVTGQMDKLEEHHVVGRFFGGPDEASNYLTLSSDFHAYLHYITNVTKNELVGKRIMLSHSLNKHLLDEQKHKEILRDLDVVDNELVPEYIFNMMYKLPDSVVDTVIFHTLVSCFKTIRDQHIKIKTLLRQQEAIVSPT